MILSARRGLVLVSLLASLGRPEDAPTPLCALVKGCGLPVAVPGCTAAQARPVDGVVYDEQRCAEPRDLLAHGVAPSAGIGAFVFPFLGGRYRVVYDIAGEAPVSETRFQYLADNLPLAARLATRFSKTKYVMEYIDRGKRFRVSRAGKMTGEAELLFADLAAQRRAYYGWGTSKFGPWKLHGSAYVDVRVHPSLKNPNRLAYDVRIRTAPVNAMVNAIMRLGLFRGYVVGQIEDTMKDLVGAASSLSAPNLEKILTDPTFTAEEREKVRSLAALPD